MAPEGIDVVLVQSEALIEKLKTLSLEADLNDEHTNKAFADLKRFSLPKSFRSGTP